MRATGDSVEVGLLRTPTFLALWGVGALNSTGRWLDMLVVAIFVLDASDSPFLVASMLMLRLLPMALFGWLGGIIAHRFERWQVLRVAYFVATVQAFALFSLAQLDVLQVWHAGVASFVSGMVWSTDFPVRRTLMGDIAGVNRVGRAMSIDMLAGSGTRMLGPLVGGVLYQEIGLAGALALSAGLYFVSLAALLVFRARSTEQAVNEQSMLENLREGWRILRGNQTLRAILAVTVVFNVWGFPFVSMVPVFGKDVLGLSDAATGFLVSIEGVGALLGALTLSLFARSEHARFYYFGAVTVYCLFALTFAFSRWFWVAALLLSTVGFVSAAFGSMQSALILMNSPKGYERQMMGVLSVCIGTAPIGLLHIGVLADWLGVPMACAMTGAEGTLAMLFVFWRWPGLLTRQSLVEQ